MRIKYLKNAQFLLAAMRKSKDDLETYIIGISVKMAFQLYKTYLRYSTIDNISLLVHTERFKDLLIEIDISLNR